MAVSLSGPHRRYNPLLDEWVLCSPHRLARPWQGQVETDAVDGDLPYDPGCYLCPRNERAGGHRNPDYAQVWAFDNDFPALTLDDAADGAVDAGAVDSGTAHETPSSDLLVARPARGICRVLCFSPRHDLTLARMSRASIRLVVDAWASEVERLGVRDEIGYVQVFENKGAAMGCSNPHPHCQIWATGHVPLVPQRKLETQRRYFATHGRDLLGDYLDQELGTGERVVCANDHWAVVVPFWAVWPFETMLLPKRRVADLPSLDATERDALAAMIASLTTRYDNLFRCSFPYSMGWHGRPVDGQEHAYWRLHAVFLPPLLRSATVRKFLVGYELTAEPQRDLTPEQAAAQLRGLPDEHYLGRLPDGPFR
jgi:UDPglucose--hexose-1-phosphate uridylyltransferase